VRGWTVAIALVLAAAPFHAQPKQGPFGSVAGGEFTASLSRGVERILVRVGPTPVACEVAADRATATCDIPTTLGPGLWPVEIETITEGRVSLARAIVELRVPSITAAEPLIARPGSTLELEIEAPIPTGEPVELLVLGSGFERVIEPQLVRGTRLRVRLPRAEIPGRPVLQLRVRDMVSEPFAGLVVNRWLALAMSWSRASAPASSSASRSRWG
jgi:hypothetical protein